MSAFCFFFFFKRVFVVGGFLSGSYVLFTELTNLFCTKTLIKNEPHVLFTHLNVLFFN